MGKKDDTAHRARYTLGRDVHRTRTADIRDRRNLRAQRMQTRLEPLAQHFGANAQLLIFNHVEHGMGRSNRQRICRVGTAQPAGRRRVHDLSVQHRDPRAEVDVTRALHIPQLGVQCALGLDRKADAHATRGRGDAARIDLRIGLLAGSSSHAGGCGLDVGVHEASRVGRVPGESSGPPLSVLPAAAPGRPESSTAR